MLSSSPTPIHNSNAPLVFVKNKLLNKDSQKKHKSPIPKATFRFNYKE